MLVRTLVLATAALAVAVVTDTAGAAKTPACTGRYVVPGTQPIVIGAETTPTRAFAVSATQLVIATCGTSTKAKAKGTKKGTVVSARWKQCGSLKNVVFKGKIATDCKSLAGALTFKEGKKKRKLPVLGASIATGCGDGLLDEDGGEECESSADCPTGQQCADSCGCEAVPTTTLPAATTTTTITPTTTTSTTSTTIPVCGDGVVNGTEDCEPTDQSNCQGLCQDCQCPAASCGNGVTEPLDGEVCDDGNTVGGDGCGPTCLLCGNGTVDEGEDCDDDNVVGGDGCGPTCKLCGDGVVDADGPNDVPGDLDDEECDDGNVTGGDGTCGPTCKRCGDGTTQADLGETCDDGNVTPDATCGPTCLVPACPNGVVDFNESCDDDNADNNDSCPTDCTIDTCSPSGTPQQVTVTWAAPSSVAGLTVAVDYPEGKFLVPGSSGGAQAAFSNFPNGTSPQVNDLDHVAQVVVVKATAITPRPGTLFKINGQTCTDQPAPSAGDFTCAVLAATAPDGITSVDGATCTVAVP